MEEGNPLSGMASFFNKLANDKNNLAGLSSILFFVIIYATLELGAYYLADRGTEGKLLRSLRIISFSFALIASVGFFVIAQKFDIHLISLYFISFVFSIIASFIIGYYIKKVHEMIRNEGENNERNSRLQKILYGALMFFLGIALGLSGFFLDKTVTCFEDKDKCKPQ